MKKLHLLLLLFLTACSTLLNPAAVGNLQSTPTQLILVTEANDATPTSTPFQPQMGATGQANSPLPLSTSSSWLTSTPTPLSTVPFDPNSILPTPGGTPASFYAPPYAPVSATVLTDDQVVTFLLLGSDRRSSTQTYFRTDTIVIVLLRPATMKVSMVSLPRDLYVYIPTIGMDRINTAYEYGIMHDYPGGGEALLKDTILYNLGIRIDHLAIVDFDGFRKIVDTLEGVDVPVYCAYTDWHLIAPDLDPENEDNWEIYTTGPGLVHMDGDLALWYARSRSKSSDFDRGRRSQEVLRALYQRALSTNAIGKIPELYQDLSSSVITDLTLSDLLSLAPLALKMNNADIRGYYIGRGYVTAWMTPGGASVQLPNGPAIQSMLQQALSASEQPPEEKGPAIEVRNGTVNPGWDSLAAERLNYAGYNTRLAASDRQDYSQTLFYGLAASPDMQQVGTLLSLLGLGSTAFVSAPMENDLAYVLVLGADYQPCFNPQNINP